MTDTATIAFNATIEDSTVQEFLEVIAGLPKTTKKLNILISTNGGSITYGFALHNILKALPYKIIMHNTASVDSIGLIVFLAGEERYSVENGTFMIHGVKCDLNEMTTVHAGTVYEKYSVVKTEEEKIRSTILEHTSITKAELNALFNSGELKDAKYALSHKIINEIKDVKLEANPNLHVIKCQK